MGRRYRRPAHVGDVDPAGLTSVCSPLDTDEDEREIARFMSLLSL